MVDALASLATTLAVGAEEQMTTPVCSRWVVLPNEEDLDNDANAIYALETDEKDWRQPIIDYLEQEKLPSDLRHKTEIRRRASRFLYYNKTLYRRSFLGLWLRCLDMEEAKQAIEEAHLGAYDAHQSGPKLHDRIKRMGYYWPTMVQDCIDYAKRCDACQFHANFIHQPPKPLHPTVASWPFEAWGLDVVRPITPKSSACHSYNLAATDYFSK